MAALLPLPPWLEALRSSCKCFSRIWFRVLLLFVVSGMAAPQSVITNLPGFSGPLPFKLETGYISVGELGEVELFYYFVESQGDPKSDPLMLWLTGGPGCSSLSGLIYQIGPLTFDFEAENASSPVLVLNKYAWTKLANIIFLDSPVGTGFSYATTQEGYHSSDTESSADVYEFLRKWLILHPQFLKNPFYITGDSYSGIPVPIIVDLITKGNEAGKLPHMNIQGYVLGNPHTNERIEDNEIVRYLHGVGIIPDKLYEAAKNSCKGEYYNVDPSNSECLDDLLYIDLCSRYIYSAHILEPQCAFATPTQNNSNWRRKLLQDPLHDLADISTKGLLQSTVQRRDLWCRNYNYLLIHIWANDPEVREALHVRHGTKFEWKRCNKSVSYTEDVSTTIEYHRNFSTTTDYRVLIYSGDHDRSIPYLSTQAWIGLLDLVSYDRWRPWFVQSQVGGYVEVYTCQTCNYGDYTLTFATVKGGGHTAPEYRPKECFAMIQRWLAYYFL